MTIVTGLSIQGKILSLQGRLLDIEPWASKFVICVEGILLDDNQTV